MGRIWKRGPNLMQSQDSAENDILWEIPRFRVFPPGPERCPQKGANTKTLAKPAAGRGGYLIPAFVRGREISFARVYCRPAAGPGRPAEF
jgi:hypothetical protein